MCKLCNKAIALSNMGKQALSSHEKSISHTRKLKAASSSTNVRSIFQSLKNNKTATNISASSSTTQQVELEVNAVPNFLNQQAESEQVSSQTTGDLVSYCNLGDKKTEAEILWVLHTVESHESNNSVNKALPIMKKCSKIAK